jgi:hypothetical protein
VTPDEARELGKRAAEKLLGTCQDIPHLGDEFEEASNHMEFCDALDDAVFCCTACGWWFEQPAGSHPQTGEWVCDDCFDEAFDAGEDEEV